MRLLNKKEAERIIETRKPLGKFIHWDYHANIFVAIDNSTGDAWTEEFKSVEEALAWLEGEEA